MTRARKENGGVKKAKAVWCVAFSTRKDAEDAALNAWYYGTARGRALRVEVRRARATKRKKRA